MSLASRARRGASGGSRRYESSRAIRGSRLRAVGARARCVPETSRARSKTGRAGRCVARRNRKRIATTLVFVAHDGACASAITRNLGGELSPPSPARIANERDVAWLPRCSTSPRKRKLLATAVVASDPDPGPDRATRNRSRRSMTHTTWMDTHAPKKSDVTRHAYSLGSPSGASRMGSSMAGSLADGSGWSSSSSGSTWREKLALRFGRLADS